MSIIPGVNGSAIVNDLKPPAIGPQAHEADYTAYSMNSLHMWAFATAAFFTVVAILLSIHLIFRHFANYHRPNLQRHVYRILLMCPIYAICSLIGIGFPRYSIYFDVLRDSYEAYTIYSFVKYLIAVLGEEKEAITHLARKSQTPMLFPLNYILAKPWGMGTEMVYKCKYGALQYVIVKPLCAVVVFISETFDFYEEGEWDPLSTYPYVSILSNTSQLIAMYCLLQFFVAADEELAPWHPVPKFLSVKAVVFFTFWQGVVLQILMQLNILVSYDPEYTTAMLQVTLQNWLVCLEMCIVSVYHHHAFPVEEYEYEGMDEENAKEKRDIWNNFKHGMAVSDMVQDVDAMAHLQGIQRPKHKTNLADLATKLKADAAAKSERAAAPGDPGDEEHLYQAAAGNTEAKQRWKKGVDKLQDRLRPSS